MKIMITGGAGFIGSHVADMLIERGNRVVVVDNLSSGSKENVNPKAVFYKEDLDSGRLAEIFEKEKPEVVYHLAAQIDVRKSVENPIEDAKINIIGTLKLLDLCVKNNVKHFIFSSTGGAIYGDLPKSLIPTKEEQTENPESPYGCAKLAIEKYLKFYNKTHGLKYTILRYSNVYGPRQNSKGEAGVIAIFLDRLFSKQVPVIYGGVQTRDFVYVKDVARANILALNDNKSEVYNVSSGIETDIIEIFTRISKYFNSKIEPEFKEMRKGEQKKSCLDSQKIQKALEWSPRTGLDDGLDKTYGSFLRARNSNS